MNSNEERLQRCFDNDLDDAELKVLFAALAGSASLREEFRSFQQMRSEIKMLDHPSVPASLDRRMDRLTEGSKYISEVRFPVFSRLYSMRLPVPVAAAAALFVVILIGSVLLYTQTDDVQPETQYVYKYEMQPVVVQSHFIQ